MERYAKYTIDDDVQPLTTGPSVSDTGMKQSISKVRDSFQQLEQQLNNVQQLIMQLKKESNASNRTAQRQRIQSMIKDLPAKVHQSQEALDQFQKRCQSPTINAQQRAQLMQTHQNFQKALLQKNQQVQGLSSAFSKLDSSLQQQDSAQDPLQAAQNFQIKMLEEDIDAEFDSIVKISQQAQDVKDLMVLMSDEVEKCGETINLIDDHVTTADEKVVKAVDDLKTTRKIQKSKNKWLWIGLAATAVIAVVLILIFVV